MHQIVLEGSSKSSITPKTEYIMYFLKKKCKNYKLKSTLPIYAREEEI